MVNVRLVAMLFDIEGVRFRAAKVQIQSQSLWKENPKARAMARDPVSRPASSAEGMLSPSIITRQGFAGQKHIAL